MSQSLTYYITMFVLKLKGIKKDFSQDPIDYIKIRKEDVITPKGAFFKHNQVRSFKVSETLITEIATNEASSNLVLFIHGGAFISGPAKHHWDTLQEIAKKTKQTIWMCDYPKAPENKIFKISNNIDAVYAAALEHYGPNQISLLGDSVGATLITALVQRLIKNQKATPNKIILVSPVMDASMTNPEIEKIDHIDPMLSKKGVLSAKQMCIAEDDLKNEMISPLYGSFEQFPNTIIFMAENDITLPDQKLAVKKLQQTNVHLEVIEGKSMPHIWPFLPVMKEAKKGLEQIIMRLNN